jgi:hypothetical protein
MRRIGVLMGPAESDPQGQSEMTAFRQGLQMLGWTGRNVRVAYRWADGGVNRMRTFAGELIALQSDAILAVTTPVLAALVDETRTVPIVFRKFCHPKRRKGAGGSMGSHTIWLAPPAIVAVSFPPYDSIGTHGNCGSCPCSY